MKNNLEYLSSALVFVSLVGCAEPDVVPDDAVPSEQAAGASTDLVAAMAFDVDGAAVLVDAPTQGAFPGSFRLGALPPPPASALARSRAIEEMLGEPGFVLAKIAGVPRNHAATLHPNLVSVGSACGPAVATGCIHSGEVCSHDRAACTQVELQCNFDNKDCRLTKIDGSAELLAKSLRLFAGYEPDYALLYVGAEAPMDSLVSQSYARSQPLAPGYHLVQRKASTETGRLNRAECGLRAAMAVIADYSKELGRTFQDDGELLDHLLVSAFNAKYGTKHTTLEQVDPSTPEFLAIAPAVLEAFDIRLIRHELRRHCFEYDARYEVVGAPDARALKLSFASDLPHVGDVFPDGPPWSRPGTTLDWSRAIRK